MRPAAAFFERSEYSRGPVDLLRVMLVPEWLHRASPGVHPAQILARLARAQADADFAEGGGRLGGGPGAGLIEQRTERRLDPLAPRRGGR